MTFKVTIEAAEDKGVNIQAGRLVEDENARVRIDRTIEVKPGRAINIDVNTSGIFKMEEVAAAPAAGATPATPPAPPAPAADQPAPEPAAEAPAA